MMLVVCNDEFEELPSNLKPFGTNRVGDNLYFLHTGSLPDYARAAVEADLHGTLQHSDLSKKLNERRYRDQLTGVEFDGRMLSATSADQAGLAAIRTEFMYAQMMQEEAPVIRDFTFENGTVMDIDSENILTLGAAWKAFRESFFPNRSAELAAATLLANYNGTTAPASAAPDASDSDEPVSAEAGGDE